LSPEGEFTYAVFDSPECAEMYSPSNTAYSVLINGEQLWSPIFL